MSEPSGIFLLNKPKNITSNDLIQNIKRKFNFKKIGHAGTLDPLATGLMVILINQATKVSNYLLNADKSYRVTIKLFIQTNTLDITGDIIKQEGFKKISKLDLKKVLEKYNGYIYDQYPPMFSAIKINGKKLYEYARKNENIDIKPRKVTINLCNIVSYDQKLGEITLDIKCSKGTYIRSLVNDLTFDLGTIGTVKELVRLGSGNFTLDEAIDVNDLKIENMISLYDALLKNDKTMVIYHNEREIRQGTIITLLNVNSDEVFIVNNNNEVIAIYEKVAHQIYKCKRGMWNPEVVI